MARYLAGHPDVMQEDDDSFGGFELWTDFMSVSFELDGFFVLFAIQFNEVLFWVGDLDPRGVGGLVVFDLLDNFVSILAPVNVLLVDFFFLHVVCRWL